MVAAVTYYCYHVLTHFPIGAFKTDICWNNFITAEKYEISSLDYFREQRIISKGTHQKAPTSEELCLLAQNPDLVSRFFEQHLCYLDRRNMSSNNVSQIYLFEFTTSCPWQLPFESISSILPLDLTISMRDMHNWFHQWSPDTSTIAMLTIIISFINSSCIS